MKRLIFSFFKLFYSQFEPRNHSVKKMFLLFFFQKIIGINRKVPWPVHFTSTIKAHEKISRGTLEPGGAPGNYIDARNGIIIEENVWIGPNVSIVSMNHDLSNYNEYIKTQPIRIGKNSLLLNGCTVLPGVSLAEHTVVAAGAVVTKSFDESDVLLGGVPAKVLKKLSFYKHLK